MYLSGCVLPTSLATALTNWKMYRLLAALLNIPSPRLSSRLAANTFAQFSHSHHDALSSGTTPK